LAPLPLVPERKITMADFHPVFAADINTDLLQKHRKGLLRLITCGSTADGKSTLIKRLLHESSIIFKDQSAAFEADAANTDQIDLTHQQFSTERRRFIVADVAGPAQYTRSMITAATTADLAIILIDARKGLLEQTRRHSYLVSLVGVRHVLVAVSKMDLVDYSEDVFQQIKKEYLEFSSRIGIRHVDVLPVSGIKGDNIVERSSNTPWYQGSTLLHHLQTIESDQEYLQKQAFRLPVQGVSRSSLDIFCVTRPLASGTIASGLIRRGQQVRVQPSGRASTVTRIVSAEGDLDQAVASQCVTLTLADEMDISCGDVISDSESAAEVAAQFQATLVWMHDAPMLRGRSYLLKIGHKTVTATVLPLKHKINVNTLEQVAAQTLERNEIGVAELELDRLIAFDAHRSNRHTAGFILLDSLTNHTVGAGALNFALRRAHNIHWQALDVNKQARRDLNGHGSGVIWLTGLSGAGKSTIANALEKLCHASGIRTYLLDGDNVRHGLNKDLGFTATDRVENIRRVAEVAKLMVDAGVVVITAFISPFLAERTMARNLFDANEFCEVHVKTPLSVAESRDVKGLYKKARSGQLKNFTGIDSPYEEPLSPEILIESTSTSADMAARQIYEYLARNVLVSSKTKSDLI
jgi:bifunctional enzyme CysN/CysC